MEEQLLSLIRSTDHQGNLNVPNTHHKALSAIQYLEEVTENLKEIQELDLEIGDLVETDQGGGIVKGFDAGGAVIVDLPSGAKRFNSGYFSPNEIRKPTPQEKLKAELDELLKRSVQNNRLDIDQAVKVLVEIASEKRSSQ